MSNVRRLLIPVLLVGGALSLGPVARGDVVTTTAGLVLEGPVERGADGSLTVKAEAGSVRLAASSVRSVVPGERPRAALPREAQALSAADTPGRYRLSVRPAEAGA